MHYSSVFICKALSGQSSPGSLKYADWRTCRFALSSADAEISQSTISPAALPSIPILVGDRPIMPFKKKMPTHPSSPHHLSTGFPTAQQVQLGCSVMPWFEAYACHDTVFNSVHESNKQVRIRIVDITSDTEFGLAMIGGHFGRQYWVRCSR